MVVFASRNGQQRQGNPLLEGGRGFSSSPSPGKTGQVVSMGAKGEQALHEAAKRGDAEAASSLLEALYSSRSGALESTLNARDIRRRTPLHVAAAEGFANVVKLLLDYDAGVNALDGTGETALHTAAGAGHVEVVTTLLNRARKVLDAARENDGNPLDPLALFLPDRRGQNALYRAAHRGHAGVVRVLMQGGGGLMEVMGRVDDEGNSTALHAALGAGHVGVVRVMLECVDEDVRKKMVEAVDRWNTKAADLQEEGMLVAGVRAGARDRAEVGREVRRERAGRGLDGILGSGSGHERGTAGCVVASNRSGFFAGGVRERRLGADLRERSRSVVKEMRGIIAQSLTGEIQPGKLYLLTHDDEPKPAMGTSAREVKCDFDTEGGQQKYSQINFRFDCTDEEFEDDGVDMTGETGHYEEWFDLDEDCQIVFDFSCPPLDDADDEGFEDGD